MGPRLCAELVRKERVELASTIASRLGRVDSWDSQIGLNVIQGFL
jgi:hypothetical protein